MNSTSFMIPSLGFHDLPRRDKFSASDNDNAFESRGPRVPTVGSVRERVLRSVGGHPTHVPHIAYTEEMLADVAADCCQRKSVSKVRFYLPSCVAWSAPRAVAAARSDSS